MVRENAYCPDHKRLGSGMSIQACQAAVLNDPTCARIPIIMYGNGDKCRCVRSGGPPCDYVYSSTNNVYEYNCSGVSIQTKRGIAQMAKG
eukprot:SAG31_NODE_8505_length_1439_cov_1.986567_1_plen_89_part_01